MKEKQTPAGTTKSRKRTQQVEAGAYDGRYRTRVVKDKKAEQDRKACRSFNPSNQKEVVQ